mgnify:FL=1
MIPCDGVVGNSPGNDDLPDPGCVLVAGTDYNDESPFVCESNSGFCMPGEVACASACFTPCDGSVGCTLNGRFGDENPSLCGAEAPGMAGVLLQAAFSEPVLQQEATSEFVPGDRVGDSAVFSATENSVFLISGKRGSTHTSEVWSYNLAARSWQHLFRGASVHPRRVLAATYDYSARQLLVLDEVQVEDIFISSQDDAYGNGKAKKKTKLPPGLNALTKLRRARLIRYDLATGASSVVATWPRHKITDRFAMSVLPDGSFVLFASGKKLPITFALKGRVTDKLQWQGVRILHGRFFLEPSATEQGVAVALRRNNHNEFALLASDDFHGGAPPGEM